MSVALVVLAMNGGVDVTEAVDVANAATGIIAFSGTRFVFSERDVDRETPIGTATGADCCGPLTGLVDGVVSAWANTKSASANAKTAAAMLRPCDENIRRHHTLSLLMCPEGVERG